MQQPSRLPQRSTGGAIPALLAFAFTIFCGSFLLFQVQPLLGKYILPWFGGGPGVWTTCLLFFQVMLLAGYAYAYLSARWLRPRAQAALHLGLIFGALAMLPVTPGTAWAPTGRGNPVVEILVLLAAAVGLPYLVLAATSPLLQQWFTRVRPGTSPYRLYALSNVGSLLALLSYPFFFEAHFSRNTQALLWGWGLAAYAIGVTVCSARMWRAANDPPRPRHASGARNPSDVAAPKPGARPLGPPSTALHALWLLLPACASVLLLATTNKLCLDMAVIPFLWVLPLAVYLLSFIVCFDHPRWYQRYPFALALIAALGGICWTLRGFDWSPLQLVLVYCGALFVCCMVCHGELYRLRPAPERLTAFYLMIAAGGALGAALVALAAPALFSGYYELQVGALLCASLFLVACLRDRTSDDFRQWRWLAATLPLLAVVGLDWLLARLREPDGSFPTSLVSVLRPALWAGVCLLLLRAGWRRRTKTAASPGRISALEVFAPWAERKRFADGRRCHALACGWLAIGVLTLAATLWFRRETYGDTLVYGARNFFGVLKAFDHAQGDPPEHILWVSHGRTLHGAQFLDSPKSVWPTLYYSENSGVGLAVQALPPGPRRIGLVGLGSGTLATYARPEDWVRVYELDPQMYHLATSRFSYLGRCSATVEVALGDARLSLEREAPRDFDLLVLDAFSSDAIPVHLLTAEAFAIYQRHLNTNGILAVHISNKWLDLEPVLANAGRQFNYALAVIEHVPPPEQWWLRHSVWALLTRDPQRLDSAALRAAARPPHADLPNLPLWTDDFASLFQIMR